MRNPNGYGTVYKLKGRRRNPWAARVTVGKKVSKSGRIYPNYQFIGYYRTRSEALDALAEYNVKGGGVAPGKRITLGKVYQEWSSKVYPKSKISFIQGYESTWKSLSDLEDLEIQNISIEILEEFLKAKNKTGPQSMKIKSLINHLFKYAAKYEWISTEKARVIGMMETPTDNPRRNPHKRIPEDLIRQLWEHQEDEMAKCSLFLIYTGLRLNEFLNLVPDDVNLEEHYFHVPESKTPSGVRNVPIHDRIFPWIVQWMENGHGYICPIERVYRQYYIDQCFRRAFQGYFSKVLGVNHNPHDCRHTFISRMKELMDPPVPDPLIKSIVGHSTGDITSAVYTHYSPAVQLQAVNRIK